MESNMLLAFALTLLSISAPITAAYATRNGGKKETKPDGNGYSTRDLAKMDGKLELVIKAVDDLKADIKQIWSCVGPKSA